MYEVGEVETRRDIEDSSEGLNPDNYDAYKKDNVFGFTIEVGVKTEEESTEKNSGADESYVFDYLLVLVDSNNEIIDLGTEKVASQRAMDAVFEDGVLEEIECVDDRPMSERELQIEMEKVQQEGNTGVEFSVKDVEKGTEIVSSGFIEIELN